MTAYATVEEYCAHEVDPMWVEAEQLQISALTSITAIPVEIVYFDQSPGQVPGTCVRDYSFAFRCVFCTYS